MFSFHRLLPLWWALLFVSSAIGQEPAPQVVSPLMLANNPTLTTVALQKPVCVFDSFIRKDTAAVTPDYSQYVVALYGMQASAPKQNIDGFGTFRNTSGGASEPYIVARFAVPNCTALGGGASTDTLQQYLVRVGENTTCLNDPNFSGICNPPLANNTAYRFVYGLFNKTTPHVIDQTLWSDKITTKAAKSSDSIDTWPGRRSGGMIVITSILSTLLFLLLAGFVAAVAANMLSGASAGVQTTRHETTVHQQAAPKAQASADPAYSSVIQGGAPERYAAKPQV